MTHFLHIAFFIPFSIIWLLIGYQLVLAVSGYIYFRKTRKEREEIADCFSELPPVTIIVPAHNEEKVIEKTVHALLAVDYPADRLELLVINDASTDATGAILDRLAAADTRVRVLHRIPPEGGRGKAAALNAALTMVSNEFIAIYDADNRPELDALHQLVAQFIRHPELSAAVGKFRTGNRRRNLLTRFINIEGLGFQGIMQAGRWQLLGVSALSGTNYVIRRSVLEQVGGWDVEALAEDAELSVRMYQAGYKIKFVPYSVSWEQEPETIKVWLKQRTRWARGNHYVIGKLLRTFPQSHSKLVALEILYTLFIPYSLLFAILASQLIFILGSFRVPVSDIPPYWWFMAVAIYYLEVLLVLSYDHEVTPSNAALAIAMYFTYCQAWPVAVIRAFYADYIRREKRTWDKTVRFDTDIEMSDGALALPLGIPSIALAQVRTNDGVRFLRESDRQPAFPVEERYLAARHREGVEVEDAVLPRVMR